MRNRTLLLFTIAIAVTAATGIAAAEASAATLFTTTAHTTRVSVGATATATSQGFTFTSGASALAHCNHAAMNFTVAQNNDTAVILTATSGAATGCSTASFGFTITFPWKVTITASFGIRPPYICWNTRWHTYTMHLFEGLYTGDLSTGATACQTSPTTSPIELRLESAGTVSGPLTSNGRLDARFVLTGAAGAWSLTN